MGTGEEGGGVGWKDGLGFEIQSHNNNNGNSYSAISYKALNTLEEQDGEGMSYICQYEKSHLQYNF